MAHGCLIGILIMVYYNALYNWVVFHPLYNPTNKGFFIAHVELGFCFGGKFPISFPIGINSSTL